MQLGRRKGRIGILPHELGEKIYKVEKGLAAFLTATTLMTGGVVGHAPYLNATVHAKETMVKELSPEKQLYRFLFENKIEDGSDAHYPVEVHGKPKYTQGRAGLGKAVHFQSTSKDNATWVDLGENDKLKFGADQDFTVSFWVKTPGVDADRGCQDRHGGWPPNGCSRQAGKSKNYGKNRRWQQNSESRCHGDKLN